MKYVDEFRDPKKAAALIAGINDLLDQRSLTADRPLQGQCRLPA
jgi:hypothetical protein